MDTKDDKIPNLSNGPATYYVYIMLNLFDAQVDTDLVFRART